MPATSKARRSFGLASLQFGNFSSHRRSTVPVGNEPSRPRSQGRQKIFSSVQGRGCVLPTSTDIISLCMSCEDTDKSCLRSHAQLSSAQHPHDDLCLNGFLNSFRERNTLHCESWQKRFRKLGPRKLRVRATCSQFGKCGGLPRKLRERHVSRIQGVVPKCSWRATLVLTSCDFQAGATKCTWCTLLVLKSCPANFKEPPQKRRERVDAKQAAAQGTHERESSAKAPRKFRESSAKAPRKLRESSAKAPRRSTQPSRDRF